MAGAGPCALGLTLISPAWTAQRRSPRASSRAAGDPAGIGPEILPAALAAMAGRARLLAVGPVSLAPAGVPIVASPAEPRGPGRNLARQRLRRDRAGRSASPRRGAAGCGDAALRRRARRTISPWREDRGGRHGPGEQGRAARRRRARRGADRARPVGRDGAHGDDRFRRRSHDAGNASPLRGPSDHGGARPRPTASSERGAPRARLRGAAALAGLNPHAGESLLGSEEGAVLPAAARRGDRSVPVSPNTVFSEECAAFDSLALYHDQAFIPSNSWGAAEASASSRGCRTCVSAHTRDRLRHRRKTRRRGHPAGPRNLVEALEVARRVLSRRETAGPVKG